MPIINQVVSGSGGGSSVSEPYLEFVIGAGDTLVSTTSRIIDLTGVKVIPDFILAETYRNNTAITGVVNMSSVTTISNYSCYNMFYGATGITSVNLSSLTSLNNSGCLGMFKGDTSIVSVNISSLTNTGSNYSMREMFRDCTGLTSFDLSNLTNINGNNSCESMFRDCISLTQANFPSLTSITGNQSCSNMFYGCTGLTSIDVSLLTTISVSNCCGYMFQNCTSLPTIKFQSLKTMSQVNIFHDGLSGCTSLQSVWFYALTPTSFGGATSQFNKMLNGCTNVTVHFPMAIQSTIGSWSDVTAGFNGTNTTVSFDLVTSLTGADSNTYTRSEKNSTTTATAWDNGGTLYYTSGVSNNDAGVNEPSVSDAIYSDDACTTSVTTITAIA